MRAPRLWRGWLAALVACALACATSGRAFDVDSIPKIRPGATTQAEVERWFGRPSGTSVRGSAGTVSWRYDHSETHERSTRTLTRIGWFLATLAGRRVIVPPVDVGYSNTVRHRLEVEFRSDGVVRDYHYQREETPTKIIR